MLGHTVFFVLVSNFARSSKIYNPIENATIPEKSRPWTLDAPSGSCNMTLGKFLKSRLGADFSDLETYPITNYRIKYEEKGRAQGGRFWKTRGWVYCRRAPENKVSKKDYEAFLRFKAQEKTLRRGRFMCINGEWDADWREKENEWGIMICPNWEIPGQWAEVYPEISQPEAEPDVEELGCQDVTTNLTSQDTVTYYVDASTGRDYAGHPWGLSETKPVKTIRRAIYYIMHHCNHVKTIIYVKNGTYPNWGFGTGGPNNFEEFGMKNFGASAKGVGMKDVKLLNFDDTHFPVIPFDGHGGIFFEESENIEIAGFEIHGLADTTTYEQAMEDRVRATQGLGKNAYFMGRGLMVRNSTNIYIHDNHIHDCPNNSMSFQNCTGVTVENNLIHDNMFWTSTAESAIAFNIADDHEGFEEDTDEVTMAVRNNTI